MLREIVKRVELGKKAPGFFYITIYVNENFFMASIEEFGDFFDYYGFLEHQIDFDKCMSNEDDCCDEKIEEHLTSLHELSDEKLKLVLTVDDDLSIPDESNRLGLNVIENATDHDFYITSFYRDGKYMWKRIYFRLENDLE